MFYVDDDWVKLTQGNALVCPKDDIPRAVQELMLLQQVADEQAVEDSPMEDRFTHEGIDRFFEASPNFTPSQERWEIDSACNWKDIPGPTLFNLYQKHAESFCQVCLDHGEEPTYEGFRQWLVKLRDFLDIESF